MQGTAWIGLFRRIPASLHDSLVLMTSCGMEIVLNRLIRLDREFVVAMGRLSGTTDQPKLLIVPYDQMSYVSITKKLSEEEIQGAIGKPGVVVTVAESASAPAPEPGAVNPPAQEVAEIVDFPQAQASTPATAVGAEAPQAPGPAGAVPPKNGAKVAPPSKTILLARLRERLANEIAKQPGG
jgi:hypothetical protein